MNVNILTFFAVANLTTDDDREGDIIIIHNVVSAIAFVCHFATVPNELDNVIIFVARNSLIRRCEKDDVYTPACLLSHVFEIINHP